MNTRLRAFVAASSLLAAALALAAVALADAPGAAGAGELWEVTSSMSMQGFAMPPQTHRSCTAKGAQEPAGASAQPGCTASDFKVIGNKTSWRVECAGPPPMKGTGEITRTGADAYSGAIRFSSEQGAMTLKLNGRRVGACTPGRE
jgi:hypothetical protein